MSSQIKVIKSNNSIFSVCAFTIAATVMTATPTWTNAQESVHNDDKAMTSGKMDHSKMKGMSSDTMDHSKMNGMSMTGDTDYDFAANMRMHHQMAVDMSQAELKNGKNPQMLLMAKDIIAAQKKEIAVFDKWLKAHKKPEMKRSK